jgi:hypothetical protein
MKILITFTVKVNHHPKFPFGVHQNLCENSKSLIISIDLCNIKNMIDLSNLELDELSSLFSHRDLRDSSFQDTIIKVLCLGRSFLNLIKENHGLHEDDVIAQHMIPTTIHEETEFISDSNTYSLKRHYMTFYWKLRKDLLDCIEDSMSHDSLIGSTISTRSKKSVSCASKISSPSVLSHDTNASKVSEKEPSHMIFILRTSIMHFYLNLTLKDTETILRRNSKKIRIM